MWQSATENLFRRRARAVESNLISRPSFCGVMLLEAGYVSVEVMPDGETIRILTPWPTGRIASVASCCCTASQSQNSAQSKESHPAAS